jgi:hypothetical protein
MHGELHRAAASAADLPTKVAATRVHIGGVKLVDARHCGAQALSGPDVVAHRYQRTHVIK